MDFHQSTYYKKDDLVVHPVQIDEGDLKQMIEDYLISNAEFDFDEIELINNRPMNVWLTAKCMKYIDPDEEDPDIEADVETNERYKFQHETDQEEW